MVMVLELRIVIKIPEKQNSNVVRREERKHHDTKVEASARYADFQSQSVLSEIQSTNVLRCRTRDQARKGQKLRGIGASNRGVLTWYMPLRTEPRRIHFAAGT